MIWVFIPSFWYASNTWQCATCGWSAPHIVSFLQMSNAVINELPSYNQTLALGSRYQIYWPRQWWIYQGILSSRNPQTILWNVVAGTIKNIEKQQSHIRATADLMTIYGRDIITDGWLGFAVIVQPWPILRDYQILLDLDKQIADKIYDIGSAWWHGRTLSQSQINAINIILRQHEWSGSGQLFRDIGVPPNASSTDILHMLMRLNNRHKKILVLWWTTTDNFWWTVFNTTVKNLRLNENYFISLQEAYICSRINQSCSATFKTFKDNISNISKTFSEQWPEQARDKISRASKRLATRSLQIIWQTESNFYKNNIDDYTAREAEILSSQPGWRNLKKRTGRGIISWMFQVNIDRNSQNERNNMKNEVKTITQWTKSTREAAWKMIGSIWRWITNIFQNNQTQEWNNSSNQTPEEDKKPTDDERINNIVLQLQHIDQRHNNTIAKTINIQTTDLQTILAGILVQTRSVNSTLNDIVYNDLALTCELQCSNLWWRCR